MTGPTRQQRGGSLEQVLVRVPKDLRDWLRDYAHSRKISQAVAIREALESLRQSAPK